MQNVKFKHISSNFKGQVKADIESIKRSKNIYIFANKTNTLYETDAKNYNKLLISNISKTGKKSDSTIFNTLNRGRKNIAEKCDIAERVNCFSKLNAFVTLKEHKDNFQSNPKGTLINPATSDIREVSQFCTENINTKV